MEFIQALFCLFTDAWFYYCIILHAAFYQKRHGGGLCSLVYSSPMVSIYTLTQAIYRKTEIHASWEIPIIQRVLIRYWVFLILHDTYKLYIILLVVYIVYLITSYLIFLLEFVHGIKLDTQIIFRLFLIG